MGKNEPDLRRDMKKRAVAKLVFVCSGLLLFFVSTLLPADLGVKFIAGWTHSGVYHPPPAAINRFGFGTGIEIWVFKHLGIEIDTIYCRKGYYVSWEDKDHVFAELSFPVLLKTRIFLDRASTASFAVFGGGAYSRFLTEMDENYGQHDWGIIAGASLEKRLGNVGLMLEGRHNWGLLYQSDEYMPGRFSFKTRTFFLLAGVNLHL